MPYPDEEEIKDMVLDDERERRWRMVFEDNNGGVDGTKVLLHAKKQDVYNSEKEALVKCGYSIEFSEKDRKKVILEVVNDRVVEEGVEHEELYLRGFGFNLCNEEREGCVGEDVKELPYLFILMKLLPGDWEDQLDQMNKKVDKDNGRGGDQENGQFRKLRRFSRNELWNNIGCLLSAPTFGLRESRPWEKDPKISGEKRKRSSIR